MKVQDYGVHEFLLRPLFWLADSCNHAIFPLCIRASDISLCVLISPYKDASQVRLRSILMFPLYLNYLQILSDYWSCFLNLALCSYSKSNKLSLSSSLPSYLFPSPIPFSKTLHMFLPPCLYSGYCLLNFCDSAYNVVLWATFSEFPFLIFSPFLCPL